MIKAMPPVGQRPRQEKQQKAQRSQTKKVTAVVLDDEVFMMVLLGATESSSKRWAGSAIVRALRVALLQSTPTLPRAAVPKASAVRWSFE